jgi:hypothetical protein
MSRRMGRLLRLPLEIPTWISSEIVQRGEQLLGQDMDVIRLRTRLLLSIGHVQCGVVNQ